MHAWFFPQSVSECIQLVSEYRCSINQWFHARVFLLLLWFFSEHSFSRTLHCFNSQLSVGTCTCNRIPHNLKFWNANRKLLCYAIDCIPSAFPRTTLVNLIKLLSLDACYIYILGVVHPSINVPSSGIFRSIFFFFFLILQEYALSPYSYKASIYPVDIWNRYTICTVNHMQNINKYITKHETHTIRSYLIPIHLMSCTKDKCLA